MSVMERVKQFIDEKGVIILDGGFSNQLSTYNVDFERTELWTATVLIEKPELIKQVHLDYLKHCDIITSVTYQATFQKLRKFGYSNQKIEELFKLSIQLAEEAIDESLVGEVNKIRPLIAISIGSYGAYLCNGSEYKGNYDLDENGLIEFHKERIDFIATKLLNGKHLIAIETIPSLVEAKALIKLLEQYDLNAWISFSCKDDQCISDGTPIETLVELVRDVKQIFAIGINCVPPEYVEGILKRMKQANTNKLKLIYPNNGDLFDEKTRTFIAKSSKFNYIDKVLEWKKIYDLSIVGGCCRIGPEEIAKIRSYFI